MEKHAKQNLPRPAPGGGPQHFFHTHHFHFAAANPPQAYEVGHSHEDGDHVHIHPGAAIEPVEGAPRPSGLVVARADVSELPVPGLAR